MTTPSDLQDFHAALDLTGVVPERFARYRPAVADGLLFFLENLPIERSMAILAEQAAMPATAGAGERLVAIARRCPALHKLGQVLARDRRLPADFRRLLQGLETMKPAHSLNEVRPALEAELGPLADLDVVVDEEPLAEASVAIVVPFLRYPRGPRPQRGVFKLLKAGVEEKLAEELELLHQVGELLDERCVAYGLPAIDYAGTFARVRDLLDQEVRLDREQAHLRTARAIYAGTTWVIVPEVYDLSTPRLTAMERIDGIKVTDVGEMPPGRRRALAERIVEALVAHPLWSSDDAGMFHADPHAGNLLVTEDDKLAILDWSLVGALSEDERAGMSQILIGALTLDVDRIAAAIALLAERGVDADMLRAVVARHVHRLPDGALPGLTWLTGLMDDAVVEAQGRFAANPILFRKILQTLKGVVADVFTGARTDRVLAVSFLRQLAREWGQRSFSRPFSRQFPTRISNAELWHLMLSVPVTGSRYLQHFQQGLAARALSAARGPLLISNEK